MGVGTVKSGGSVDVVYAYMFYITFLNRKAVQVPERLFLPNLVLWIIKLMRKSSDSSINNTGNDYAVTEHLSASVVLISWYLSGATVTYVQNVSPDARCMLPSASFLVLSSYYFPRKDVATGDPNPRLMLGMRGMTPARIRGPV